ncbi:MAG: carboxypeptidase-like regulatory domain-containing protein, partial [archaeon]
MPYTDFSKYTTGEFPSDWFEIIGNNENLVSINDMPLTAGNKILKFQGDNSITNGIEGTHNLMWYGQGSLTNFTITTGFGLLNYLPDKEQWEELEEQNLEIGLGLRINKRIEVDGTEWLSGYKVVITPEEIKVIRQSSPTEVELVTSKSLYDINMDCPLKTGTNNVYLLKTTIVGNKLSNITIKLKLWKANQDEPQNWSLVANDYTSNIEINTGIDSGYVGFINSGYNNQVLYYHDFISIDENYIPYNYINGIIRDELGNPLKDAYITIYDSNGNFKRQASNSDGTYSIPLVFYNDYTLIYTKQKKARNKSSIYLNSNINKNVTLHPVPTEIYSIEDLYNIRYNMNQSYVQKSNIDFNDFHSIMEPIGYKGVISNDGPIFKGNYNGKEFSISNLNINFPNNDYIGLFARPQKTGTETQGKLENIIIRDSKITGKNHVGGLVGEASNFHIENCSVINSVIDGKLSTGGLAGKINFDEDGSIITCYSNSEITGTNDVGGLIGSIHNNFVIRESYTEGKVTGLDNIGGLVGSDYTTEGVIENSWSRSRICGSNENVGGLIGKTNSFIKNCYAIGLVSSSNQNITYIGGLIGKFLGGTPPENSYYNTESTQQYDETKGIPLNTAQMSYPINRNMAYLGWDWSIWEINPNINEKYPYLKHALPPTSSKKLTKIPSRMIRDAIPSEKIPELLEARQGFRTLSDNIARLKEQVEQSSKLIGGSLEDH